MRHTDREERQKSVEECSATTRASADTTPTDTPMTVRNNDDKNDNPPSLGADTEHLVVVERPVLALAHESTERTRLEPAALDHDLLPRVVAEQQPRVMVVDREPTLSLVGRREVCNTTKHHGHN